MDHISIVDPVLDFYFFLSCSDGGPSQYAAYDILASDPQPDWYLTAPPQASQAPSPAQPTTSLALTQAPQPLPPAAPTFPLALPQAPQPPPPTIVPAPPRKRGRPLGSKTDKSAEAVAQRAAKKILKARGTTEAKAVPGYSSKTAGPLSSSPSSAGNGTGKSESSPPSSISPVALGGSREGKRNEEEDGEMEQEMEQEVEQEEEQEVEQEVEQDEENENGRSVPGEHFEADPLRLAKGVTFKAMGCGRHFAQWR